MHKNAVFVDYAFAGYFKDQIKTQGCWSFGQFLGGSGGLSK